MGRLGITSNLGLAGEFELLYSVTRNVLFLIPIVLLMACGIPLPPARGDTPANCLYHVAGCQKGFVACTHSKCWYSQDGLTWRFDRGSRVTVSYFTDGLAIDEMVGAHTYIVAISQYWAISQHGGRTWTVAMHDPRFDYLACLGDRCYGISGEGAVWATVDGDRWEALYKPSPGHGYDIDAVATYGGRVVARVGRKGFLWLTGTGAWVPAGDDLPLVVPLSIENDRIGKWVMNDSITVAISQKRIYFSTPDGRWSPAPLPLDQIHKVLKDYRLWDICYAKGLFVVVGTGDLVLTSNDGMTWVLRSVSPIKYELEPRAIPLVPMPWPKRWF